MIQSIHELLTILERAQSLDTRSSEDLPLVTVTLNGGSQFAGNVLGYTSDGLRLRGEAGTEHYLTMREVAGVTLTKVDDMVDVLSSGRVERPLEHAPKGMALRRYAAGAAKRIGVTIALPAEDLQGGAQSTLVRQLKALEAGLEHVIAKRGGIEKAGIKSLTLQVGAKAGVTMTNGALVATFDPTSGPSGRLSGEVLVRAIQSA